RAVGRGCGQSHRQRVLQGRAEGAADGVCRRGAEVARGESGRLRGLRTHIMLEIRGLSAAIEDKPILQGIDLVVPQGEVHAIMGPNGSGKSTLAYVLSGREDYVVTGGSVTFDGHDLLAMEPEARAVAGLFLAFQYPVELPGVGNANFLRTALNAQRRVRGESELDAVQFLRLARAETKRLAMPEDMLRRNVNVGF